MGIFADISRSPRATIKYSDRALGFSLHRVRGCWRQSRKKHDRFSTYDYLTAVFGLGMVWQKEKDERDRADRALKMSGVQQRVVEPFAAIIRCTSSPKVVDQKTRSKWTRALMFAAQCKDASEGFECYIRRYGGINRAAAEFTSRLGRIKK